jgi:adenine-specific DNA-methyltransferase
MQGLNFQIDKEPLLAVPLVCPDTAVQEKIAGFVERVIACGAKLGEARSDAEETRVHRYFDQWESQLQTEIESLYGLSSEEIEMLRELEP